MVHRGLFAQFLNEPWGKLKILDLIYKPDATNPTKPGGGGGSTQLFFFQVGVCGLDFRSVGLANWYLPLKEEVCQLKISKFWGLRAKIWAKIEAVEAKISKFSQKGDGLVNCLFCLKWDPCELKERCEKGVFSAAHPHTAFLVQCHHHPPD